MIKSLTMKSQEWDRVPLGDLCDLVNGDAYRESDWSQSGVPIIRIQNLNNRDKPFNCWAGALNDRVVVNDGDLLLAWSGTPGTSFGAHLWNRGLGVLNQHIFRVDLDRHRLDSDWALHSINHGLEDLIGKAQGAVGLRHVTKGECKAIPILLPPLVEQRQLAGRLREQLAAVADARTALQAQLAATAALPAAHLRKVFSSAEAEVWPSKTFGEFAQVVGGIQKTPDRTPRSFHRPFLTVRNVQQGFLNLDNVERFELSVTELNRSRLEKGDLLIVEGNGSLDHIGRSAVFQEEGEWIHQNHIIRVRLPSSEAEPTFVSRFLASPNGREQMIEKAKTTTGLHTLSTAKVAQLSIPLPPLEHQRALAAELDATFAEIATLRTALEARLAAVDRLPAALLREVFGG